MLSDAASTEFLALAAAGLAAGAALFLAFVFLVNRYAPAPPARVSAACVDGAPLAAPSAGDALTLATWNLGYAGLGADSEFWVDGGRRLLAPSRASVRRNAAGILATLRGLDADVALLQEIAERGPLNRNHNLRADLDAGLDAPCRAFAPDFRTIATPYPLRASHGLGLYARRRLVDVAAHPLPNREPPWFGCVRKRYLALSALAPIAPAQPPGREAAWMLFNLHLAPFAHGRRSRQAQLAQVLAAATAAYRAGRHVVIGGDFNMAPDPGAATAAAAFDRCGWLEAFPSALLEPGWRLAFDPARPTVRALTAPYEPDRTPTAVIDGFILAPNVELLSVSGVDAGFAHSDHNPVLCRVRARPEAALG